MSKNIRISLLAFVVSIFSMSSFGFQTYGLASTVDKDISVEDVESFMSKTAPFQKMEFSSIGLDKFLFADDPVYLLKLTQLDSWGSELYVLRFANGNITELIPTNTFGLSSLFSYSVIKISQGTFIAVYSASHMGNGSLLFLPIDTPTDLAFSVEAIDNYYESTAETARKYNLTEEFGSGTTASTVFSDGKLNAIYADVNNDYNTDVVLEGILQVYRMGKEDSKFLEREFFVRRVFLFDSTNGQFEFSNELSLEIQLPPLY